MLLVDKLDVAIKAKTCVDGSKQRSSDGYKKHDYDFIACATNSVMITAVLESKEGRNVAIIYIHGEYLHTYVDKHGEQRIIMLFKGKLAELMTMVDPNLYQKYVTYDNKGNAILYVEMKKAFHGLVQSSLL